MWARLEGLIPLGFLAFSIGILAHGPCFLGLVFFTVWISFSVKLGLVFFLPFEYLFCENLSSIFTWI
jgi:hypothetical protein